MSAETQTRTGDPLIFSQVLYQLSYLGMIVNRTPYIVASFCLLSTAVLPLYRGFHRVSHDILSAGDDGFCYNLHSLY